MSPSGPLPPDTPPAIRLLLRRCLTKDARKRLHRIADARIELESVLAAPTASTAMLAADAVQDATQRASRGLGRGTVAALLLVAAGAGAALAWFLRAPEPIEQPAERCVLTLDDPEEGPGQGLALSPDGQSLLFVQERTDRLARLSFETGESGSLPGIERGFGSSYSPDGESIVFRDGEGDRLLRAPARGGPATVLLEPAGFVGGIAPTSDGGLHVSRALGEPAPQLLWLPPGSTEPEPVAAFDGVEAFEPSLSSDEGVLFVATRPAGSGWLRPTPERCTIEALRLSDNERRVVFEGAVSPRWSPSGHVVVVASGGLLTAIPFDLDRLEVSGAPVVVERPPRLASGWKPTYALGADGTLAYQAPAAEKLQRPLTWLEADGGVAPVNLPRELQAVDEARLSPDGRKVAFIEDSGEKDELWVVNFEGGAASRLGERKGNWDHPVWSSDGRQVFSTDEPRDRTGPYAIWRHAVDFTVAPEKLLELDRHLVPFDVTLDGRTLIYGEIDETAGEGRIRLLDLETLESTEYLGSLGRFLRGRLSPDGRLFAYSSRDEERSLVTVRPFQGPGKPVVLSSEQQASVSAWSADSSRLIYWAGQLGIGRVLSAEFGSGAELEVLETRVLVDELPDVWSAADYDSQADRLLWLGDAEAPPDMFILVRNFDEHLRRVAPPSK